MQCTKYLSFVRKEKQGKITTEQESTLAFQLAPFELNNMKQQTSKIKEL